MSRTDKTKPFRVKALHKDLAFREEHAHVDGECDLPSLDSRNPFQAQGGRCTRVFQYTGTNTCACPLCAGSGYERRSKKSRRDAKAYCHGLVRGAEF